MRVRVGAATHRGKVRPVNEDVYVVRAAQGLFVVCDGMGGGPEGEIASRLAAETIARELSAGPMNTGRTRGDERRYLPQTSSLAEAVRVSNDVIYRLGQSDPCRAGMGTTVVSAWLGDHIVSLAHVGDSRAYMWHQGRLQSLTCDHTLMQALLSEGVTDACTTLAADQRNVLVRVLGGEADVEVELREVPLEPGDYLLLCSDGLTNMVAEAAVCDAFARMRHPQQICEYLVDAANANGGADNVTVVIVQAVEDWRRRLKMFWNRRFAGVLDAQTRSQIR